MFEKFKGASMDKKPEEAPEGLPVPEMPSVQEIVPDTGEKQINPFIEGGLGIIEKDERDDKAHEDEVDKIIGERDHRIPIQ